MKNMASMVASKLKRRRVEAAQSHEKPSLQSIHILNDGLIMRMSAKNVTKLISEMEAADKASKKRRKAHRQYYRHVRIKNVTLLFCTFI